ncbi:ribonuclease 3-like [Prosopis cineraria]|uniref:ribonuclease 3-like n=1 Tax=Prosopis cineraria TaxID=364024 RepID=UPI00240ECCF5|nr:ribonuclease 3-like [Prosopis cineraria]
MNMKPNFSLLSKLIVLQCLSVLCCSQDFDFFYFVQQWPGAFCDTKHGCCYPKTGKPTADFGIHGLWPNYKDGSWPSNCDPDSVFDKSQIAELMSSMEKHWPSLSCPSSNGLRFWSHEWQKHGTCSESELDQRDYFDSALKLKQKANLLNILHNAGIKADDGFYSLESIKEAIKNGVGFTPGIECNVDAKHKSQLYQVYLCADTSGSDFIECPILPTSRCGSQVQFPKF